MSDYGGDDDGYEPYEPDEPAFDEEEPFEPQDPDDIENPDGTARNQVNGVANGEDPDAKTVNGNHQAGNVVAIGDPSQTGGGGGGGAATGRKNAVVGLREKKIPDEKRSTTPYMTKYERARVLGTRALQIR
ncbi:DNA-directed RNA polymerases I II and III subunit RPABC2 [Lignoscripta atroalba]|nr:DNA-directed RNA polymerases I II and III subunit RPABC2 [Lignoscripta atroalba]